MALLQKDEIENDNYKMIYKASVVNAAVSTGHGKHGNEFFYINFA